MGKKSSKETRKSGPVKKKRPTVEERREYIENALTKDADARLPLSSLISIFGCTDTMLRKDEKCFKNAGKPFGIVSSEFVFTWRNSDDPEARELTDLQEKRAIANAAEGLILGGAPPDESTDAMIPGHLQMRLTQLWQKANRIVILDAGSTTKRIAQSLAEVRVPTRHLSSLRVITNSLDVANVLRKPQELQRRHETILVGGVLGRRSKSIAGTLAERSLDAMRVSADIAVVGAASLNERGEFGSRDEKESQVKCRLLRAGRIRCIAAHSSKLLNWKQTKPWSFAACTAEQIDIVITDSGIHAEDRSSEQMQNRRQFLKWIESSGIHLAVGRLE